MQPSTTFDWGRVVTPARWTARVIGLGAGVLYGLLTVAIMTTSAPPPDAMQLVVDGLIAVGLLVAAFWKGIGEIAGGLVLLAGAVVGFVVVGGLQVGALTAMAPFLLASLLFIACGWYTLTQERHTAAHATI